MAGDAAHAMGPSAGAGMMVGVLGAWRLGWRLAFLMKNLIHSTVILDDYSKEQRVGADEIQNNNAMIFKNLAITNPILAGGRSILLKTFSKVPAIGTKAIEKEALISQKMPVKNAIDQIRLKGATILKSYGKWIEGKRVPYILEEKDFHPLNQIGIEHTLISIEKYEPEEEYRLFSKVCKAIHFPVHKHLLIPNENSNYRKNSSHFLFALVRPDQHVVLIFKAK